MTTLDLHPEELFDKAAQGTLSEAERALLEAHLERCALCRFERRVTADFAALPGPDLDVDRLVTNALTARSTRSLRRRPGRGAALLAAAVALVAMGSFAAVGQWTGVLPRLIGAVTGRTAAPRADRPAAQAEEAAPAAPAPPAEAPPAEPPPPAPPLVQAEPAPPPTPEPARVASPTPTRAAAPVEPSRRLRLPPPPTELALVGPPPGAAELFASATRARLDGDRPLAMARYRQLLAGWPASLEAAQTRASLGRLLLDDGAPGPALELLDGYLRGPDGALREEVLAARARALGVLGRAAEEARAWQVLIDEYPDSLHAERARVRLGSLAASP